MRTVYILLFTIFFLLELPLLDTSPRVMVDEPWYANTAWNFSIGNGFTNTVPGSHGGDDLFLFTFLLGVVFKLLGTSLLAARMVSIIGGLVGLAGFLWILKELKINSRFVLLFAGLIFIISNVNYIIFRSVRPESWVVAFGIWALYFLIKSIKTNKELNYLFCGLLSSAVFLCHPHGALYILLFGIIVLLYCLDKKRIRALTYYILGIVPMVIILLLYLFIVRQETLLEFFGGWSNRVAMEQNSFMNSQMRNLITFFRTYTLGLKRLLILFFELGVLLYGLFFYKKNKYVFMISITGLSYFVIAMSFLSPFVTRHFGEVLIFSFITFALVLDYYIDNSTYIYIILIVGFLYLANNLVGDLYIIWRDHGKTSYSEIEEKIDEVVPDDKNVLSLLEFWFPLKNNNNFNSHTRWHNTKYTNLDHLINSQSVNYIVISDYLQKGVTPTSGRKIIESNYVKKESLFYNKVQSFAESNGSKVYTINSKGYGKINIYKIN